MSRLIDADTFAESLINCKGLGRKSLELVLKELNEQPAVYDVEKVVAELEYQKEHFEKDRTYWADHTWKDNVVYCNWDLSDKKVNCYESAIGIVRKGGVE